MFKITATAFGTTLVTLYTQTEEQAEAVYGDLVEANPGAFVAVAQVEHDCFGRVFCGTPREVAKAECPACSFDSVLAAV